MSRILKIDLVNAAYSLMRMSGITLQPSGDDITLAVGRLEDMVAEFAGRNIDLSWNAELEPDGGTRHGMPFKYFQPISANLAGRLLADFGMVPNPSLIAIMRSGFSFISSDSAAAYARETQYPSRQPIGSGINLRYNRYQRFYRPEPTAPIDTENTYDMFVGDIDIIDINYSDWLRNGEDITEYALDADPGITVNDDTLDGTTLSLTIEADGRGQGRGNLAVVLKIKATTSRGRVQTRIKYFNVNEAP